MKRTLITIAALALSYPAFAQVRAGVGVGASAGARGGAAHVGANAGLKADAGAEAKAANSNAGGDLRGLERAETRMSEQGKTHEKATVSHGKRKGPRASAETRSRAGADASTR